MANQLPADEKQRIIQLYQQLGSVNEVAKMTKHKWETVNKILEDGQVDKIDPLTFFREKQKRRSAQSAMYIQDVVAEAVFEKYKQYVPLPDDDEDTVEEKKERLANMSLQELKAFQKMITEEVTRLQATPIVGQTSINLNIGGVKERDVEDISEYIGIDPTVPDDVKADGRADEPAAKGGKKVDKNKS